MTVKIEIKSVLDELLFEFEKENNSIKETLNEARLQRADLQGADLQGADLHGADLQGANLQRANLHGANLQRANMPIFSKWSFSIRDDNFLKIGCKEKTFDEWAVWFKSGAEYNTKRGTEEFRQIEAMFLAHKAYHEHIKHK